MFVVSYTHGITFDLDKLLYIQLRHNRNQSQHDIHIYLGAEGQRTESIVKEFHSKEEAEKAFSDISNLITCDMRNAESA